jgi:sulfane dehydrogenase subunit SoxC
MGQDSERGSDSSTPATEKLTRRTLLATAAAGLGTAMIRGDAEAAQQVAAATETSGDGRRLVSDLGQRSPHEKPRRLVGNVLPSSASKTPLQDLDGIITPSDLHYERHHTGVPRIDPDKYTLRVEGLVERPMTFDLKALKKLPERSVIRYMECGSNGIPGFAGMRPELTPQEIDGMVSTSEWTGTTLASLWDIVRPKAEATWFYVEGHDGGWTGSIPMSDRWDDSLIAWGQNGEAIRPEQGYPARLLLAGHPGGPNIKWISRIELKGGAIPEQTVKDFSSVFGAKSLITYPAYPNVLEEPGNVTISGLAWSGRGKIAGVDISADGGNTWEAAELQEPVLSKCQTRFRFDWNWDGNDALLMSRATDETGNVQIKLEEARLARETSKNIRHYYNNIRAWAVATDGTVTFGLS